MTDARRHLSVTRAGGVATVALDRPPVNAVDLEVIDDFLGTVAELALACDVRLMARGGEIGFPEIRLGFFPGAGGTQRLTRLVGPARALRLMMEGRRLTADEAHALGLVDEVVPADLLPQTARDVAERLASGPTRAIGLLKRCVYQGYGRPLAEGLALEAGAVSELIRTADAREGMEAFLAKRPPRFTGV